MKMMVRFSGMAFPHARAVLRGNKNAFEVEWPPVTTSAISTGENFRVNLTEMPAALGFDLGIIGVVDACGFVARYGNPAEEPSTWRDPTAPSAEERGLDSILNPLEWFQPNGAARAMQRILTAWDPPDTKGHRRVTRDVARIIAAERAFDECALVAGRDYLIIDPGRPSYQARSLKAYIVLSGLMLLAQRKPIAACLQCSTHFVPHGRSRFCSNRCRVTAHNHAKAKSSAGAAATAATRKRSA